MKLSILMPTYNGASYIEEQIGSILGQDDSDFELLVVDDGSTDQTVGIVEDFQSRDRRVRLVPSTGNCGQKARIVQLLSLAGGQFVAIADQDDIWAPDRNSILIGAAGDTGMAMGRSELIDQQGRRIGSSLLEALDAPIDPIPKLRALIRPLFSAHAIVGSRELFTPDALYSSLPFDWLIALSAIFQDRFRYRDDAVTFHRLHDSNQSNRLGVRGSRWSPSYLKWLLLFRTPDRLRFYLALAYLSQCNAIDRPLRDTFKSLAENCRTSWFSEWRSLVSTRSLNEELKRSLVPFAASAGDARLFGEEVDILTSASFGKPFLSTIWKRFRA